MFYVVECICRLTFVGNSEGIRVVVFKSNAIIKNKINITIKCIGKSFKMPFNFIIDILVIVRIYNCRFWHCKTIGNN